MHNLKMDMRSMIQLCKDLGIHDDLTDLSAKELRDLVNKALEKRPVRDDNHDNPNQNGANHE
jgi:hypothetical protein